MGLASNSTRVTKIKDIIKTLVNSSFSSTLGREPDIVNIVNALILRESSFNVNSVGKAVSTLPRTGGAAYFNSSAITSLLNSPSVTPTQVANIYKGIRAVGVMQVMGWNFVKGGAPSGVPEIQRLRPDLAGQLLVEPGEDIYSVILGESNLEKAILAGLIMLEGKYRAVSFNSTYYSVKGDYFNRKFSSRMQGAIASYLGLGASDANGTTPMQYASQILGGSYYVQANGSGSLYIRDSEVSVASSTGPTTNGTGLGTITTPGCSA